MKSKNYVNIYIREENLKSWMNIKKKSDFVNWCLKHKLSQYKFETTIKTKRRKKEIDKREKNKPL